jgi:hypothetical protein
MRAVARFAGVFPIQPWLMHSLRSSRAIDVLFAIATPPTGKKNEAMGFIQRYLEISHDGGDSSMEVLFLIELVALTVTIGFVLAL